jgi:hypothetical protein
VTLREDTVNRPLGSTDLVFQAPPTPTVVDDRVHDGDTDRSPSARGRDTGRPVASSLRMLKGARQAAAGMKISDDQIRAVLEDPQDVQPDPNQPHRTRLSRDGVTVTTGNDGMILRVTRRR